MDPVVRALVNTEELTEAACAARVSMARANAAMKAAARARAMDAAAAAAEEEVMDEDEDEDEDEFDMGEFVDEWMEQTADEEAMLAAAEKAAAAGVRLAAQFAAAEAEQASTPYGWLVEAHPWSENQMDCVVDLTSMMSIQRVEQLKLLKATTKMNADPEGSEKLDPDDTKVFSLRKHWMARWSKKCGSLEITSKFSACFISMNLGRPILMK